jgi:hypothetical protein
MRGEPFPETVAPCQWAGKDEDLVGDAVGVVATADFLQAVHSLSSGAGFGRRDPNCRASAHVSPRTLRDIFDCLYHHLFAFLHTVFLLPAKPMEQTKDNLMVL